MTDKQLKMLNRSLLRAGLPIRTEAEEAQFELELEERRRVARERSDLRADIRRLQEGPTPWEDWPWWKGFGAVVLMSIAFGVLVLLLLGPGGSGGGEQYLTP